MSGVGSFIVALSRAAAAALLWLGLLAAPALAEVLRIDQVEVAAPPGAGAPGGTVAQWLPQALPDDWGRTRPEHGGTLWYRFTVDARVFSGASIVPAIYIERVCSNLAVYLNGALVGSGGSLVLPYSRNCFTPQFFTLPLALLSPGVNTVTVQVVGYPLRQVSAAQRSSGLSVIRMGDAQELRAQYEQALWWNITLPKIITAVLGAFTVFIGALWLTRPQDSIYGYFTLWIGWWTINTARLYVIDPPLPGPWIELLVPATAPVCVSGLVLFMMRFLRREVGWINQVLWWQIAVIPVVFLLSGTEHIYPVARAVYLWLVPQFIGVSVWFTVVSWRVSRRDFWLFSAILLIMIGIIAVEFAAAFFGYPLKMHLGHLGGPVTLIPLCLRLIGVFGDNLRRSEELNDELERRVRQASSEIERSYAELALLRAREAAQEERRRIASDLHDDLGAKLLSIAHESARQRDREELANLARQALDEMRLSVQGMVREPLRAADVLADWRAETVQRLMTAGLQVEWTAAEPPADFLVPARAQVQLTRVLREAVSNVIRHSGARRCRVTVHMAHEQLALTVEDDGVGMDVAGSTDKGHGLGGIERRVRTLGGQSAWRVSVLGGVCLEVSIPVLPDTVASQGTAAAAATGGVADGPEKRLASPDRLAR